MAPDEFLAWEREQEGRYHYVRGEVFAMAGETPRHSHLAARMISRLDQGVRDRRCDVHTSDLRLGIPNDEFVYADAVVVRRPVIFRPTTTDVVANPTVVVEVLSKSTERYDRGDKQAGYLALPSIAHYVLVSQRVPRVEVYTRQDDGSFRFDVHQAGGVIRLERIGVTIPIDDLYERAFELQADA
jgi:Uma2 family endonuclease